MTSGREDRAYTNQSKPQAHASSPPPINWSTRPKVYARVTGGLDGSQSPSVSPTMQAESATDDSGNRRQLELLLHHLGHRTPAASGKNVGNQQDGTDFHGGGFNGVDNPTTTSPQFEHQDGLDTQNEPFELLDLTAAFSALSTSNVSTSNELSPLVPRAPPSHPPYTSNSLLFPVAGAKYYVVIKGKCTGVYYGEWDNIRCLTDFVPSARHKSFKTLEQATEFYLRNKKRGDVDFIRNPGDVARFGRDEDAIQ